MIDGVTDGDDKSSSQQDLLRSQLAMMRLRVSELESVLETSRKEFRQSQEMNAKLQFDLQEVTFESALFVFTSLSARHGSKRRPFLRHVIALDNNV